MIVKVNILINNTPIYGSVYASELPLIHIIPFTINGYNNR